MLSNQCGFFFGGLHFFRKNRRCGGAAMYLLRREHALVDDVHGAGLRRGAAIDHLAGRGHLQQFLGKVFVAVVIAYAHQAITVCIIEGHAQIRIDVDQHGNQAVRGRCQIVADGLQIGHAEIVHRFGMAVIKAQNGHRMAIERADFLDHVVHEGQIHTEIAVGVEGFGACGHTFGDVPDAAYDVAQQNHSGLQRAVLEDVVDDGGVCTVAQNDMEAVLVLVVHVRIAERGEIAVLNGRIDLDGRGVEIMKRIAVKTGKTAIIRIMHSEIPSFLIVLHIVPCRFLHESFLLRWRLSSR